MEIGSGKHVEVAYSLHVGEAGEERELMEEATKEKPLGFIFGGGSMLGSFEAQLKGKRAGEEFAFSLSAGEAYGDFRNELVTHISKSAFAINGKFDEEIVQVDKIIPMYDSEGHRLEGVVLEVNEETVLMDFNHPLAGETLHFAGSVLSVREATIEELAAVSAQSHSCGSGCGGCGGGCGQ
ncbi:MAG: FKBP-type peptidyl-prolyl cis-trans isomerase [Tannerellaceae bacterium]|jgi:FKBP-type peptidyl-prolyl cis-trans isomerase SlyD|nr:FKBP-type peptidyl-prolyl cis-trans isomerase [Tannerellaceae bacterium]